jgi:hypothetical protein
MKPFFQMRIVTDPKIDILNFKLIALIKQSEIYSSMDHNKWCVNWLNTDTRKSKATDTSYYHDEG